MNTILPLLTSFGLAFGVDGALFVWGDNADGQLGDNSHALRLAECHLHCWRELRISHQ